MLKLMRLSVIGWTAIAGAAPSCIPCVTTPCACEVVEVQWEETLMDGHVGEDYLGSPVRSASGTWNYALSGGTLPEGMSLEMEDGLPYFRGAPSVSGDFHFTVIATEVDCFTEDAHDLDLTVAE